MRTLRTYKILIVLFGLLIFGQYAYGQYSKRRYLIWFSPSQATHVYGCMINFFFQDETFKCFNGYPKIYGAEININPLGVFFPFMTVVHSFDAETHVPIADSYSPIMFDKFKKVNGLQIGLVNMEPTVINGLDINATGSFESKTNGLTFSLVMNKHYEINGLTFAAIANHDIKCKGVQIGLINSCKELKGFQVGIWNINQKRKLPLINWTFKNNTRR